MSKIYPQVSIHDFRVVWGITHSNVVFDVAAPFSLQDSDEEIREKIGDAVAGLDSSYRTVITIDREGTINRWER